MASPRNQIRFEADWNHVRFRENTLAMRQLLTGPRGLVAKDLSRRAIRVESLAKQYASGFGGGPNVRTGRLRSSITWGLDEDHDGLYAWVGTPVHYAPFVELGTRRMRARPYLRPALAAAR